MQTVQPARGKLLGFRSHTLWKSVLASLYYAFCALMIIPAMTSFKPYATGAWDITLEVLSSLVILLLLVSPPLLLSEFGYRDKLPLFKRRTVAWSAAGYAIVFLLAMTAIGIVGSLHSAPYKAAAAAERLALQEERDAELAAKAEAQAAEEAAAEAERLAAEEAARVEAEAAAKAEAEAAAAAAAAAEAAPVITTRAAKVTKVVDGDTIWVEFEDGTTEKVRFIGVDTPESTNQIEEYGKEASAFTANALSGKTVYLETDAELRDRYDRLLAHIWLSVPDGINDSEVRAKLFNAQLLLAGYANLMTIAPNVKYVDYLKGYEAEARADELGLWAPEPTPAPAPAVVEPEPEPTPSASYIANSNTGKFHHEWCRSVDDMNPEHKVPYSSSQAAIDAGYVPCKICNP